MQTVLRFVVGSHSSNSVSTRNNPEFLESHIVRNFSQAMSNKGKRALSKKVDPQFELRYEQDNLGSGTTPSLALEKDYSLEV